MARVLVVEDSADQAQAIRTLLEDQEHTVEIAENGRLGLSAITASEPDIVVTDLIMPELGGLELVDEVVKRYPSLPVILVTAYGSGEIAMKALRRGAASYVPKRLIFENLVDIVERIVEMARARRERERTLLSLEKSKLQLVVPNEPSSIPPLVEYVQEMIAGCKRSLNDNRRMQIGIALHEALLNAVHHGNLGVGSEIREESFQAYQREILARLADVAYRDKRLYLTVDISPSTLKLIVRDDGAGFDIQAVPDPTDPQHLLRASGRGLYLIGTFMDQVTHNESGNEITMIKRFDE